MAFNPKDYYFKKAKQQNFAARSVYKLEEIDKKFKLIKPGNRILDLGAAPGSWSQHASQKIGPNGSLIGVDLQEIRITLPNAQFIKGDLLGEEWIKEVDGPLEFDVVMSDMAPKTTGIKLTDQARSLELCEMALDCADKYLKKGGHFVCKIFQGEDVDEFLKKLKTRFSRTEILKPKSTRKQSKEIFFIGFSFRGN